MYILAGAGALLIASALPSTHPLSAVFAIMVGVPWTLLLQAGTQSGHPCLQALSSRALVIDAGVPWWPSCRWPTVANVRRSFPGARRSSSQHHVP
jgi:hypothetical protein